MKAAQKGHSSVVKLLLAAKAPVNYASSINGSTALFQATDNEQTECVRVLLNNGADANITYDLKVHCLCHVHHQIKNPYIIAHVIHRFCILYQNHCFCQVFVQDLRSTKAVCCMLNKYFVTRLICICIHAGEMEPFNACLSKR